MTSQSPQISRRALVAGGVGVGGVAVVSALFGAGTMARWTDSADVNGARVTNGDLGIEIGEITAKNVSPDVEGTPKTIDLETFRAVPGDVIELSAPVAITLIGDDLAAEAAFDTDPAKVGEMLGITSDVAKKWVTAAGALKTIDGGEVPQTDGKYRFSTNPDPAKGGVVLTQTEHQEISDPNFLATYTVTFKEETPDLVLTKEVLVNFEGASIPLEQVRTGTGFTS